MYKDKTFLAIIPARSGSKRLTNKNMLPLKNKPLIEWSINAGLNSKYIDEIVVSSNNNEVWILEKKKKVKFIRRPESLSQDNSSTLDVILHTLETIDRDFDYFVLLQPTSPLRTDKHIDEAIEKVILKKAYSIISVSECEHPPIWSNTLPKDGSMSNFIDHSASKRRSQDHAIFYRLNGAIYIVNTGEFKSKVSLFDKKSFSYVMKQESSIDIDTELDFIIAESIITKNTLKDE